MPVFDVLLPTGVSIQAWWVGGCTAAWHWWLQRNAKSCVHAASCQGIVGRKGGLLRCTCCSVQQGNYPHWTGATAVEYP